MKSANYYPVALIKGFFAVIGIISVITLSGMAIGPRPAATDDMGSKGTYNFDTAAQQFSETALDEAVRRTQAKRGAVIILEAHTGLIVTIADVGDIALKPWEPGSVMKPLLLAAALNEGSVSPTTDYYDKGFVKIGERTIINAVP